MYFQDLPAQDMADIVEINVFVEFQCRCSAAVTDDLLARSGMPLSSARNSSCRA